MMGTSKMVRQLDELGRIVLPREVRDALEWGEKTPLVITPDTESGTVTLKRSAPTCMFCGAADALSVFEKQQICKACQKKIAEL